MWDAARLFPDPAFRTEVARRLAEAPPPLPHPWEALPDGDLAIVGYGSLVNRASAALTLSEKALETFRPVVVFGARRVFDYRMPVYVPRYGLPASRRHRAALNVRPTGDPDDTFNGVLLEIPAADLPALRKRERSYDLVQLPCADWEDPAALIGAAWILSAPAGSPAVDPTILPHVRYVEVCREGAARIGEEFSAFWEATTFLADGVSPVSGTPTGA